MTEHPRPCDRHPWFPGIFWLDTPEEVALPYETKDQVMTLSEEAIYKALKTSKRLDGSDK